MHDLFCRDFLFVSKVFFYCILLYFILFYFILFFCILSCYISVLNSQQQWITSNILIYRLKISEYYIALKVRFNSILHFVYTLLGKPYKKKSYMYIEKWNNIMGRNNKYNLGAWTKRNFFFLSCLWIIYVAPCILKD